MDKLISFFVTLLIASQPVYAENNRGVSFILQMCSAKATTQRKFWKAAYANSSVRNAGWLYGNTSKQNGCQWSDAFMKDSAKKRVRVHICNCTCFPERGRRCESNECFAGLNTKQANAAIKSHNSTVFSRIDGIIKKAIADHNAAPTGTVIDYAVSPCLESGLDDSNRKIMLSYIEKKFEALNKKRTSANLNPIRFVDNPYGHECISGYYCEKHGTPVRRSRGIADNDGVNYDDIAQAIYGGQNSEAFMVLAWKPCLNGVIPNEPYKNPRERKEWCSIERDAANFAHFTDDKFSAEPADGDNYNSKDLNSCSTYGTIANNEDFVWKLGDRKNFTTWVTPKGLPSFTHVYLSRKGKMIDESKKGAPGRRFGTPYSHEAGRRIYDFQKPLQNYPDNAVLHGVVNSTTHYCWKFPKPSFRPNKKKGLTAAR